MSVRGSVSTGGRRGAPSRLAGRAGHSWRPYTVLLALAAALTAALLLPATPALALSQRGHVFAFSYGVKGKYKGKGEGEFREPMGVAVSNATGDVYVADHKNKRVVQLEPLLSGSEVIGERWLRSFKVPAPSQIALDQSSEASDPSKGDVYVVGSNGKGVFKFSSEGTAVDKPIKRFEVDEHGVKSKAKLEGIEGVAVDPAGTLFVYVKDGEVFVFSSEAANKGLYSFYTGLEGAPGLALDSEGNLLLGAMAEAGFPVAAKLEGLTSKPLCGALDARATTALAVNTLDVFANDVDEQNDAYLTNVSESGGTKQSTIAQFAPSVGCPSELQEFSHQGLSDAEGVAVDEQTGMVFVTDAASNDLDAFALEKAGPASVEELTVSPGTPPADNARRLSALVDPEGSDTHASIEYGLESCTAGSSACSSSGPVDLGEAFGAREVSLELGGLVPGVYHYRVAAENASGTVYSPEQTFTVLEVQGGLPDDRAWEMVSPPDKHGASVEAQTREGGVILAAEDGQAITYVANGALTEEVQGNRSPEPQQVISTRGPQGWSSQDISTPQARALGVKGVGSAPEYQYFSPDLSLSLVAPDGSEPPLAPGGGEQAIYLRADPPLAPEAPEASAFEQASENAGFLAPGFLALLSEADVAPGSEPFAGAGKVRVELAGATRDLSNVVLSSEVALTGPGSAPGLYEWSDGVLRFLSRLPNGTAASEPTLGYQGAVTGAISSDGSRVVWTSTKAVGHLYMTDASTGASVQLDAAQGVSEPSMASAEFQLASSDGSRVFFTDQQRLLDRSSAEPAGRGEPDLYECEIHELHGAPECALSDLTIPLGAGEHADVQGLLFGGSEDATTVYLVAHGVLASNQNANHEAARAGAENLYELHYGGSSWASTFIATLALQDSPEWEGGENNEANSAYLTARASPDGRYLAFMSAAAPTGYDNEDTTSAHRGERLDEEVYLYDSQTASLTCVSCDPTGARPTGVYDSGGPGAEGVGLLVDRRRVWEKHWLAGSVPGWTAESLLTAVYQPRYLTDQGRLFFDSPADLVPAATNALEDVYEYEPAGQGSCQSPSGGCVSLISSGTSQHESAFLEASAEGQDAFFLTAAQLVPEDTDSAFDIYDARVCSTESPCLSAPSSPNAPCETLTTCRPAPGPSPTPLGTPTSAPLSSPGNLTPPPRAPASHPSVQVKAAKTTVSPPTRAQKLAKALALCRKRYPHSKHERAACEAHVRKLYAPKPKAKHARRAPAVSPHGSPKR